MRNKSLTRIEIHQVCREFRSKGSLKIWRLMLLVTHSLIAGIDVPHRYWRNIFAYLQLDPLQRRSAPRMSPFPLHRTAICLLATIPLASYALDPDKLFEKLSPSCWGVTAFDSDRKPMSYGSAVVIGPGKLITNCHVLQKAKSFQVNKSNISYGATLEFADPERDLCQIKVSNFTAPAVVIGTANKLRIGQKVFAIGNPENLELTMSEGIISSLRKQDDEGLPLIQTTAPISHGSSGGGLFDSEGRLIGITTFKMKNGQNLNFAHPADWIQDIQARYQEAMAKRDAPGKNAPAHKSAVKNYSGPLQVGESWVYEVTDLYTGLKRTVTHRIDEIDGTEDRVISNQGARIEDTKGKLLSIQKADLGELDLAMPLRGWGNPPHHPGKEWKENYLKQREGSNTAYDLTATVVGEEKLVVPAGEFTVTRIEWRGYSISRSVRSRGTSPYKVTVWYSEELNRVIKFMTNATGQGNAREVVTLVRHKKD